MIRAAIIATSLALLSLAVHAQQPAQQSATAVFIGQVAALLADTITERDAARAQATACQQAAAKPPTPSVPPTTQEHPP